MNDTFYYIDYYNNILNFLELGSRKIIELLIKNGFKPVTIHETLETGTIQSLKANFYSNLY